MDEWHGTNAFIRDGDSLFRTYFINSRGDEVMGGTWSYLDMTALGRQEFWEDSPEGYPQTAPYEWWNWNDEYGDSRSSDEEWLHRIASSGQSRHHLESQGDATRPTEGRPWTLRGVVPHREIARAIWWGDVGSVDIAESYMEWGFAGR